jgi:UDP-N-acetylmuramate dehydrogenase
MSLWNGLGSAVEKDRPLAELTSMHAGGAARWFCAPEDPERLRELVARCEDRGVDMKLLGGATNVIIASDVVDAMVVRIHTPAMASLEFEGDRVTAGAGVRMERLVSECASRGLSGVEFMAGVPGTVGGAAASGASTRGGRFSDVVTDTERVGPAIIGCVLKLSQDDPDQVRARIQQERDHRKATQPYGMRSAGCVFRNPPGDSAGRLIDRAGLKGTRVGGAEVSGVHGNFIVNTGSAAGRDILELVELVRKTVMDSTGVQLELEVEIW